jgi:eukaryotic-like serine/threonine-protein kinase
VLFKIAKIIIILMAFMIAAGVATYLTVHLLIRSEHTVVIPDLKGKEVVYALEELTDLKLNTKVKGFEFDPVIPRHHVISQDPEPGTQIKQGRDVRLIISKGPRNVVLPDLVGSSLAQAHILLDQNGLKSGRISYMYHNSRPKLEVLSQYPHPGMEALRGDTVDLLVSEGPSPTNYLMMDLAGMMLNQAVTAIEQRRLVLESVQYADAPGVMERTVIDQSPPAGYPVLAHSNVQLTIARSPQSQQTSRKGHGVLFRHRVPAGFIKQRVRVRINQATMSLDIFDDYVKPGREIWLLVPDTAPTTLFLYLEDQLIATEHYE